MGTVEIRRESCGPASMFSQFYTDGSYTDMKIAAAGDTTLTIRAHKVVLAAASPYLARKIKSHKGDEGPIVLNYINFNMLKAIIDYLYHGRVVIRADEVEDFHSFRRMFEVELGPVDGAREGEGQGSSQASNIRKRNLLLRGDGPVALKRERVGVNRQTAPYGPSPTASACPVSLAPLKREPPAPPVIRTALAANAELSQTPSFAVTFGGDSGGRLSRATSSGGKDSGDSALSGDTTSLAIPTNTLSRAPNRSNFSGPHDSPVAGPRGYFWIEVVNQLDTTEHAIRDKYGDGLCHFLGNLGRYQSLYLAYSDAAKVEHVMRTVKAVEKYLPMKPVVELPSQLSADLNHLRSNPVLNLSDSGVNMSASSNASESGIPVYNHSRDCVSKKNYLRIRNFPWKKVNLLRLLRNNGLEELRVEDIFGEPGTGEYRVRLPTTGALERTVSRVNGQDHLGNIIIAEPCDGIL